MSNFSLESIPSQKGKVAIVTGANIGLGYETALALAKKDFTVVLACRSLSKAKKAMGNILKEAPKAELEIILLDLNSLDSVEGFSDEFAKRYTHLDLLIANAGIMFPPFQTTEDGFESQIGVNYLAHFLLINLLFPILSQSDGSRVILLSSLAHKYGKIDFDNFNSEKSYSALKSYAQSKLACLMFAYELQRRIEKAGLAMNAAAAHPGFSNTNLGQFLPGITAKLFSPLTYILGQNAKSGALPTLRAALDPKVKGGEYYGPSGFKEMKGAAVKVKSSNRSHDWEVASRLWLLSEQLTGKKFDV